MKRLEPRLYFGDIMQDQYEEIFEIVFILKGSVGIGYRLFNEMFYGKQITVNKKRKIVCAINDYSSLFNKCSEFLYMPIDKVEALGMRKENYNEVMESKIGKKMKLKIANHYKYNIQEPMHLHRTDMSKRYQNRIDYIDIEAYGVGKVKLRQLGDGRESILNSDSMSDTLEEEEYEMF